MRVSTASQARSVIQATQSSQKMEIAILHVGLNDLRQGKSVQQVSSDIEACIRTLSSKYPRASIGYSELLYVGNSGSLNKLIDDLNEIISMFCARNNYVYIQHRKLQNRDDLYEDQVHLNNKSGIGHFVKDLHIAFTRDSYLPYRPGRDQGTFSQKRMNSDLEHHDPHRRFPERRPLSHTSRGPTQSYDGPRDYRGSQTPSPGQHSNYPPNAWTGPANGWPSTTPGAILTEQQQPPPPATNMIVVNSGDVKLPNAQGHNQHTQSDELLHMLILKYLNKSQ